MRTDIKHPDDTFCGTKVQPGKDGRLKGTTQVRCKGMKERKLQIVNYNDGFEIQRDQGNWEASCNGAKQGASISMFQARVI